MTRPAAARAAVNPIMTGTAARSQAMKTIPRRMTGKKKRTKTAMTPGLNPRPNRP
jgi:hypothetical protein